MGDMGGMMTFPESEMDYLKRCKTSSRVADFASSSGIVLKIYAVSAFFVLTIALAHYLGLHDAVRFPSSSWMLILCLSCALSILLMPVAYRQIRKRELERERRTKEQLEASFEHALLLLESDDVVARTIAIQSLDKLLGGKLVRKGKFSFADQGRIAEILVDFLRKGFRRIPPHRRKGQGKKLPGDVRAAIAVVGRGQWREIAGEVTLDLANINFHAVDFNKANLTGANFFEARFRGARFNRARLDGSNFSRAILLDVEFEHADLVGACFNGATLAQARLEGANLADADAVGAILYGADFRGADLSGVNFRGASLTGANLEGARLGGADLRGAHYSRDTRFPEDFDPQKNGMHLSDF